MISSVAASGIRVPLISNDWFNNETPLVRILLYPENVPGAFTFIFGHKDLTSLMGALRPQSPALLAAGAFGGNFQIDSVW